MPTPLLPFVSASQLTVSPSYFDFFYESFPFPSFPPYFLPWSLLLFFFPSFFHLLDDLCLGKDKAYFEELYQELQEEFSAELASEELASAASPPSSPLIDRSLDSHSISPSLPVIDRLLTAQVAEAPSSYASPAPAMDVLSDLDTGTELDMGDSNADEPGPAIPPQRIVDVDAFAPAVPPPRILEVNARPDRAPTVPPAVPSPRVVEVNARPQRASSVLSRQPGYYKTFSKSSANNLLYHQVVKVHGKDGPHEAGLAEVRNIIGRETVFPEDGRRVSTEELARVLPLFMFYKAKQLNPDEIVIRQRSDKNAPLFKLKARWVGGGHHQDPIDKTVVAAPTARAASHNLLLNFAALKKESITIGDIPAAYLQTRYKPADGSDRPFYVRMDKNTTFLVTEAYPDYSYLVLDDGTLICRVHKALYGLVESASLWYRDVTKTLLAIGYNILDADKGVMQKVNKDGSLLITSVHVDDFMAVSTSRHLEEEFWATLAGKYPGIKIQRGPHYRHLSYDFFHEREKGIVQKSQVTYITTMLQAHSVKGTKAFPSCGDLLSRPRDTRPLTKVEHASFRSVLQQVSCIDTRPELSFICSFLQRHQAAPLLQDLKSVWHVLRYLNGAPDVPLVFKPSNGQLRAMVDASYASHPDGRSHYGYAIIMGSSVNSHISFKSGSIKTVCRSSTESEISGVNEVTSELLWTVDLAKEMGLYQGNNAIDEDNTSCITLMQQEPRNFQTSSRHIRVKFAFFRQQYKRGILHLRHCRTEDLAADILTKPTIGGRLFRKHMDTLTNSKSRVYFASRVHFASKVKGAAV